MQNAIYKNRGVLLSDCGILYPSIESNHTTPLCTMFLDDPMKHVTNQMAGFSPAEMKKTVERYFTSFESEIASSNCKTLLLSAEGLSNLNAGEVRKLKTWLQKFSNTWTVIAWVRHPVDLTRSVTQQVLKGGYTLEALSREPMLPHYKGKLSIWLHVFGKDNLKVMKYEDAASMKGGIIGAFNKLVCVSRKAAQLIEASAGWDNQSLSYEAAHILSSLNRQRPLFDGPGLAQRRTGTELQVIEKIPGKKFDFPSDVRHLIKVGSRNDVEWLNQTFDLDAYKDVFEDDPSDTRGAEDGAWNQATVDRLALTLSDLINAVYCNAEMAKGNQAFHRGALDVALDHYRKALRVCPDADGPKKQIEVAMQKKATSVSGTAV